MTLDLEQEESICLLKKVAVLPTEQIVNIIEDEKGNRKVYRQYQIGLNDDQYSMMDKMVIKYEVGKYTDRVKNYEVYLTNNSSDTVYICKYSPNILNTLFNNIILLELSNWRRASKGMKPLRTIEDYESLMFELNIDSHKRINSVLQKLVEKNTSQFLNKFSNYQNTNKIIPVDVWEAQLV